MHRPKLPVSLSTDGNRWENKLGYRCGTGRTPAPVPEKTLQCLHPHFADVLCVPNIYDKNGVNHRQRVFEDLHTTEHSGHRGQNTTMKAIQVRFYWLSMRSDILKRCAKRASNAIPPKSTGRNRKVFCSLSKSLSFRRSHTTQTSLDPYLKPRRAITVS